MESPFDADEWRQLLGRLTETTDAISEHLSGPDRINANRTAELVEDFDAANKAVADYFHEAARQIIQRGGPPSPPV